MKKCIFLFVVLFGCKSEPVPDASSENRKSETTQSKTNSNDSGKIADTATSESAGVKEGRYSKQTWRDLSGPIDFAKSTIIRDGKKMSIGSKITAKSDSPEVLFQVAVCDSYTWYDHSKPVTSETAKGVVFKHFVYRDSGVQLSNVGLSGVSDSEFKDYDKKKCFRHGVNFMDGIPPSGTIKVIFALIDVEKCKRELNNTECTWIKLEELANSFSSTKTVTVEIE